MNKGYIGFFKKTVVLILLLIATDILLGKLLAHFYFKMKTGQTARITYAMTKADEELIVFGSSRANHNYVPDILEDSLKLSVYNAGVDGQSILYHYCVLKNIKLRSDPKIILLDININEFENSEIAYNKLYALLPYYNLYENIRPVVNLRSPYESVKTISSLYRYNSFILPIVINNTVSRTDDSQKGYIPLYKTLATDFSSRPPIHNNIELDTVKVNMFRSFLQEAKQSNSRVCVFISPIYRDQHKLSPTITMAEQIAKQENVSFFDHSKSSLFNEHPEYFQDELHLNNKGAEIYTRLIFQKIKNSY